MKNVINIKGINKAEVLAALFNNAKSQGMGIYYSPSDPMPKEDAQELLDSGQTYFDYLKGRVLKIQLEGDELQIGLYDRDNGEGEASRALRLLLNINAKKKPISLISKVEIIEVEDNGSSVIEVTNECHGDVVPITMADMPRVQQMNLEIKYADVHTFTMCEDVTPEGMRPGTDILKTETKIAMTHDVQMQLGKPFETINAQAKELSELSNDNCKQRDSINRLIDEREYWYNESTHYATMSIWSRVKFLLLAEVW